MTEPHVGRIAVYPIKSLDRAVVTSARILPGGSLEHDREFALFDEQDSWINGKRESRIHEIRARYDLERFMVTLRAEQSAPKTFHLLDNRGEIEDWLGNFLGRRVSMRRNRETGFPDDLDSPGPTLVGDATLREVGAWFGITDLEEISRRFRANIEIATGVPFWEDRLFDAEETPVEFRIGDVTIHGVNPCQRCVVPSRDPSTGSVTAEFQRVFVERRAETLPMWANPARFPHFYRLAVNTRIEASQVGKVLRTGDAVELV